MSAVSSSMVTGASQYAEGAVTASGIRAEARFKSQQHEFNARQLDKQVEKSIKRGETAAVKNEAEIKLLIGEQKAALAAQGIIIDEGTAQALQDQSKEIGLRDSATIRNNAQREAMGFRFQALDMRTQGELSKAAAGVKAAGAQLSGSLKAVATTHKALFKSIQDNTDWFQKGPKTKDDDKDPDKTKEPELVKEEIFTGKDYKTTVKTYRSKF